MCVCVWEAEPLRASRQADHSSNSIIDHQRGKTAWQRAKLSQNSGAYFLFSPDATHPLHSGGGEGGETLHMAASPAPHLHLPKVPIFSARRACPLTPPRAAILSRVTLPLSSFPISHTRPFHWESRRVPSAGTLSILCPLERGRDTSTHPR